MLLLVLLLVHRTCTSPFTHDPDRKRVTFIDRCVLERMRARHAAERENEGAREALHGVKTTVARVGANAQTAGGRAEATSQGTSRARRRTTRLVEHVEASADDPARCARDDEVATRRKRIHAIGSRHTDRLRRTLRILRLTLVDNLTLVFERQGELYVATRGSVLASFSTS